MFYVNDTYYADSLGLLLYVCVGVNVNDYNVELLMQWITWFYRKLGLDLVPRQGAQMVDPDSMSVVELYHVHVSSAESSQGVSVSWLIYHYIRESKVERISNLLQNITCCVYIDLRH